jgi:hypothetical protein
MAIAVGVANKGQCASKSPTDDAALGLRWPFLCAPRPTNRQSPAGPAAHPSREAGLSVCKKNMIMEGGTVHI